MSSLIITENSWLLESLLILLSSMRHREKYMMQSWNLLMATVERSSFCIVQVVVGRHLFATQLQLLFVLKEKLFFVWHLQELHHFSWKVEKQLTLHLKFLCKSMTHHSVISPDNPISSLFYNKLLLLYGMKSLCSSTSMQWMLLIGQFRICW